MISKLLSIVNYRAIRKRFEDPLYRNSFFMALSRIFNAGCGFFFWMIAARLYTIEDVGFATALISSLGLVILFSRLGVDVSIIRFFTFMDKGRIIFTSLAVTTVACGLTTIMYVLLIEHISPSLLFLGELKYALVFLLFAVLDSISSVIGNALVADRKASCYFMQNLFMAIRIPALLPFSILGAAGILGSLGTAYLFASFFGLALLLRSIKDIQLEFDWVFIRRSFRFSSWNYLANILSAAPSMVISIMVINMLGATEAAKYYIAFTLGNLVLIIPNSFGTSLFVEGSHGEGLKKNVFEAGTASIFLLVPLVLFILYFGDFLLGMLKAEYVEAFDLLRIIAISSFPVAVYSLFVPIQNVRMKVKSIFYVNALRCLLLLGLSYLLIQRYGIIGAGYAWMATYMIIMLCVGWVAHKNGWI